MSYGEVEGLSLQPRVRRGGRTALYYPHLHFRSRKWLRSTVLYYDHLSRIVPPGMQPDSPASYAEFLMNPGPLLEDISALQSNGFLCYESPEQHTGKIALDFFDFAMENLTDLQHRTSLLPELAKLTRFFTIHPLKVDAELAKMLAELKLLRSRENDPTGNFDIEPVTGVLYMLFLATQMAGTRNLISDNSAYQSLLYRPITKAEQLSTTKGDREFRLATAVLNTAVPYDLDAIPLDKLLRLGEDLAEQRTRFQDKIAALALAMGNIQNEEGVREAIEAHERKLDDERRELEDKLRSANLTFATGLFAVSVPNWATAPWGMGLTSITPAFLGIGAIAISGLIMKNIFDQRAARHTNAMSYLLSLRRQLTPRSMAEDIITLNLSVKDDDRSGGGGFGPRTALR